MNLRVISWNLQHSAGDFDNRIRLLKQLDRLHGDWDVLLLQELTEGTWERLRAAFPEAGGAWSWHEDPGPDAATSTGAAIYVRQPLQLIEGHPLGGAPSPKRTLMGWIGTPKGKLAVGSCALPPGHRSGPWRERKVEQADLIVAWLEAHRHAGRPVILGIDANTPEMDHPVLAKTRFWYPGEARLLGPSEGEGDAVLRHHDVTDAYRRVLGPGELSDIRALRPDGPLAVSHLRGTYSKVPCRYDYILTSPDVVPQAVRYIYDDAVGAGSDHALVHGTFNLANADRESD